MKQRITWILVAVAVVAGLGWLLVGRSPTSPEREEADDAAQADPGLDRQAIVARKRQAREGGPIDLSPARALGRVTDGEGGAGIPDALVLLTPKGLDQQSRAQSPGEGASPLQARTAADGTFTVPAVPAGRYSLSATAVGYLPTTRTDVVLVAGQDNPGLELVLGRGGHEVRGTVSDIGGGPVEDVLVRVTRTDQGSPFNFDRPALGVVTDEEGAFRLQLADGHYAVATFHPDYVDATQELRVDKGPRALALTLTPAGSIEGRVLARATGQPIEGAIVSRSGESSGPFMVQGIGDDQALTDAEGRFRMRRLPSGVVRLGAVARGFATRQPIEVVLGVAEHVGGVELLVDEALTISGFVVAHGDEERGLQGVLVGAFSFEPARLYAASGPSASDGHFEIFGVLPGAYTVGAIGEDALPNLLGASAEVRDQDVTDVLVVMNAGAAVRGRVSPGVPATISVRVDGEGMSIGTMMQSMSNAMVRARSDDDGVFALHPVAEGAITLVAEADDGSRGERAVEVGTTDLDGVVIELQPRALAAGRVVDAGGAPGAGLAVSFRATQAKPGGGFSFGVDGQAGSHSATTDEDGNFEVTGLDAGDYEVSVAAARGSTLEWAEPADPEHPRAPLEVTMAEGERRQGLLLAVEARDGVLTGVVVGPDREPVADAWVTAVRNDSAREWMAERTRRRDAPGSGEAGDDDDDAEAREQGLRQWEMMGFGEPPVLTDEAGRFEVRGLRSGVYRLRAEAHRDGARGFVDEARPGDDVRLELEPLSGLQGVVRHGGKPVREYTVTVSGRSSRQQQIYAPDGRFVMSRLDAGPYEVIARCSTGTARAEVELAEGGTTSITLDIGGWGTLRGTVVDAGTGSPVAGLSITVMGDGGPSAGSMMGMFTGAGPKTDADGRFAVDEVPPGEGTILFFDRDATGLGSGGPVAEAKYEVEAEGEQDLGTITGVAPSYLPPDERGTVGLQVQVATYAKRPRAPGAEDDEAQAAFDLTQRLWVSHVTPQGPAALAGLVPGDEVLRVDGDAVAGIGAVNAAKLLSPAYTRVGDDVGLEIEHDGSRNRVTLTAQARDPG